MHGTKTICTQGQGTIHILRHHIFGIYGPPSPLRQHVFSTKNQQKLAFSDPPTSADVIYEWSLWKELKKGKGTGSLTITGCLASIF